MGGAIANEDTVRGFALKPDMPGFETNAQYNAAAAAKALRVPCEISCQNLIAQIGVLNNKPWNWETSFGVRTLMNQIVPGSGGDIEMGAPPPNRAARRATAQAARGTGAAAPSTQGPAASTSAQAPTQALAATGSAQTPTLTGSESYTYKSSKVSMTDKN